MTDRFAGVALITLAGCDLGWAVAQELVRWGCRRIVLADETDALAMTKAALGAADANIQYGLVEYNQTEPEGFDKMIAEATAVFGQINYCINCATLLQAPVKPTTELEPSAFRDGLEVSSRVLWLTCRAQIRQFLAQKENFTPETPKNAIVNVIPYGNLGVNPGHGIHAASTYGRVGMTKTMASDYLKAGIRVCAVCPGATDSKEDAEVVSVELLRTASPSKRLIRVQEVASAAVFLAGEAASGITGVALPVDAGWSMVHN